MARIRGDSLPAATYTGKNSCQSVAIARLFLVQAGKFEPLYTPL